MDSTHYQDRETLKFISYAQNFEDVILHRALKDLERGFYSDASKASTSAGQQKSALDDPPEAGFRRISLFFVHPC